MTIYFLVYGLSCFGQLIHDDDRLLVYTVDPAKQELRFFWKNNDGINYSNFQSLRQEVAKKNKQLVFAMNGGMYKSDRSPQGLYIENGRILAKIDTTNKASGNFYMQPNGVFYLTKAQRPVICRTDAFINDNNVEYATQSGPMLLIDGTIHPKFNQGSSNIHIRNGVGVLPNGHVLFAMSKEEINFYDLATFFKLNGCLNALYLDGFVSRTYLPSKGWEQLDGTFGVIIAETRN
ncbi:phosphodiester glycosidase family protein [Sungkyunkwania multivorans]|uniref:Phosphodiester glycosidase family protein n=1 Tax=Sungkyunkwania multivorans TaxID=1173618 RepID=A0ABW3D0X1_9FLAO